MGYGVGVAKKDENSPTLVENVNGNWSWNRQWWRTGIEHVNNVIKPAGERLLLLAYKQTAD